MKYYLFVSNEWEPGFRLMKVYENKSRMTMDVYEIRDRDYEMGYTDDVYTYLDTSDDTLHRL
jgi:protein associated with RNAse G/E